MGTPEFAVVSLQKIYESGIEVSAVVTVPDKPAGRGQQLMESPVKLFAKKNNLKVLQPENLKHESFIEELKKINADLFVVVAFRMLPEIVWSMPKYGTINLHASLLPQYRGAAPINWAVINGENETGATTFFIEKEIDTGKIIDQVKVAINENDNAGIVHDKLMIQGADLLLKTIQAIFNNNVNPIDQNQLTNQNLKAAPKIFKNDCQLDWNNSSVALFNKIRGLSPYPASYTTIQNGDTKKTLKILAATYIKDQANHSHQIKIYNNTLYMGCNDGWILPIEVQLEGKKRMKTIDFLNGFDLKEFILI